MVCRENAKADGFPDFDGTGLKDNAAKFCVYDGTLYACIYRFVAYGSPYCPGAGLCKAQWNVPTGSNCTVETAVYFDGTGLKTASAGTTVICA